MGNATGQRNGFAASSACSAPPAFIEVDVWIAGSVVLAIGVAWYAVARRLRSQPE